MPSTRKAAVKPKRKSTRKNTRSTKKSKKKSKQQEKWFRYFAAPTGRRQHGREEGNITEVVTLRSFTIPSAQGGGGDSSGANSPYDADVAYGCTARVGGSRRGTITRERMLDRGHETADVLKGTSRAASETSHKAHSRRCSSRWGPGAWAASVSFKCAREKKKSQLYEDNKASPIGKEKDKLS